MKKIKLKPNIYVTLSEDEGKRIEYVRKKVLGLTLDQMGKMLGYDTKNAKIIMYQIEVGKRKLRKAQKRLLDAYQNGYRPQDWPSSSSNSIKYSSQNVRSNNRDTHKNKSHYKTIS